MKKVNFVCLALILCCIVVQIRALAESATFKLPIFPLQCSIDELQTGEGSLTQITPENCIPPESQPPKPPLPISELPISVGEQRASLSLAFMLGELQSQQSAPNIFGYESAQIDDNPAFRSNRSSEVEFYAMLVTFVCIVVGGFFLLRFIVRSGFVPILLDRFRRKKNNFKD